jgi:hypothetical protein
MVDTAFVHAAKKPCRRAVGGGRQTAACLAQRSDGTRRDGIGKSVGMKVYNHICFEAFRKGDFLYCILYCLPLQTSIKTFNDHG